MQGWAMANGLPMIHVSQVCAMSFGENRFAAAETDAAAGWSFQHFQGDGLF
jgi:hypothetical protein